MHPDITVRRVWASSGYWLARGNTAPGQVLRHGYVPAENYSGGLDLASRRRCGLYAVTPTGNSKGTVWYNPSQFQSNGYTVPTTFNDMVTLSNKIASGWQIPLVNGGGKWRCHGWPVADWVDHSYLSLNGLMSDKWVAHQIPWTDPSVKNAFQMFGEIANGTHYINGGAQAILATAFQDACYLPYDIRQRLTFYLGDFAAGFIQTQFPNIKPGTDYNFFSFPTINPQYAGAITGGTNMLFAMQDNDGTRQYMEYLASAETEEIG